MLENNDLFESAIKNIKYQAEKVSLLANFYNESVNSAMKYVVDNDILNSFDLMDHVVLFKAQVDADLLLTSFASLVDYYYIAISVSLNVPTNKISRVQYKKITDEIFYENESTWGEKLDELHNAFDVNAIHDQDLWNKIYYNISEPIKSELVKWGVMKKGDTPLKYEIDKQNNLLVTPSKLVERYYFFTEFLYCHHRGFGHKFNIFIELNNFLKHNRCPLIKYVVHDIDGKSYAYSFYEIKESEYMFLKSGVIMTMAEIDFDELMGALEFMHKNKNNVSDLEIKKRLPKLTVSLGEPFEVDGELYFTVGDVLMSRTRNSISVHTKDLFKVAGCFIRNVEGKMGFSLLSSSAS